MRQHGLKYIGDKMIFGGFILVYHRLKLFRLLFNHYFWERSGSVVECLTQDRAAAGLSLTGVTALWSLSKTHPSFKYWFNPGRPVPV